MADITKVHTRLNYVDSDGNVTIVHPENSGIDVAVDNSNTELPVGIKNIQNIVDDLGDLAFKNHDLDVLRFSITGEEAFPDEDFYEKLKEINDDTISLTQGWSSFKINKLLNQIQATIYDLEVKDYTSEMSYDSNIVKNMWSTRLRKIGYYVNFTINITLNTRSANELIIGTLPTNTRPVDDIVMNTISNKGIRCYIFISSSGIFGFTKLESVDWEEDDGVRASINYINDVVG